MPHHTLELSRGEAEVLWFRPLRREAPQADTTAILRIWLGAADEASLNVEATYEQTRQRFVATLDTREWPLARELRAQIDYGSEQGRVVHAFRLDCLPDPWRPLVEARDLLAALPQLGVLLPEREAEWTALIEQAADELRALCLLRGFPPGACRDKSRLDEALLLRATALAALRLEAQPNDSKLNAARHWRLRAERAFSALLVDAPLDARYVDAARLYQTQNGVRMAP